MKNMMMVAVLSAVGVVFSGHAAQPEMDSGRDRAGSEQADPAKKCDGLNGDARNACLKSVQRQGKARSDTRPEPKAPDIRK